MRAGITTRAPRRAAHACGGTHRLRRWEASRIPEVTVLGSGEKVCSVSFTVGGIKPQEVEGALDEHDIVVRGGTLSDQPVMESLGLPDRAVRVSISFYNTRDDIDTFIKALEQCIAAR